MGRIARDVSVQLFRRHGIAVRFSMLRGIATRRGFGAGRSGLGTRSGGAHSDS